MRRTVFADEMDKRGVSAEWLAYHAGVTVGYIYKLRRGDVTPSLRTAAKIAGLLNLPVDIFLANQLSRYDNAGRAVGGDSPDAA